MDLNEQIISFIFSFLYGVIVQKLYQLSYEHIHTKKQIYGCNGIASTENRLV